VAFNPKEPEMTWTTSAIGTLIGVLCVRFLYDLMRERFNDLAMMIVRAQCRMLPARLRADREAQWLADISLVKGDAWKVANALGYAFPVARAHTEQLAIVFSSTAMRQITYRKRHILFEFCYIMASRWGFVLLAASFGVGVLWASGPPDFSRWIAIFLGP
jgi:hypothetical protein